MSNPVQGWYADPEGSDQLRWWDGTQWSDQFRPAPTGNEAASDTHPQPAAQVAQPPASQLITTGILGLLTFFFIAGAALAGSAYVSAGNDLQNAQSLYAQAEQTLQEAKDAAK